MQEETLQLLHMKVMMSTSFSPPITEQRSSYLSLRASPPLALAEGGAVHRPLLFCRSVDVDAAASLALYRGPAPGLLPYLTPFHHHGPGHAHFSVFECPFEPAFIQKRNERERQRVKCVNQGYAKLRQHLPGQSADKRLSKVETLRSAISYIKYLQRLVQPQEGDAHHRTFEDSNGRASTALDRNASP